MIQKPNKNNSCSFSTKRMFETEKEFELKVYIIQNKKRLNLRLCCIFIGFILTINDVFIPAT